jgi:hypothetical protein
MAMMSNNNGYCVPHFAQNTCGSRFTYAPNPTYASGNNISSDFESTIRSFIAIQKYLNKGFTAKFKEMDVLCERVDNLARVFTTLKNIVQRKRSHEDTMKYSEEVLEKSWETVRILEDKIKKMKKSLKK